MIQIIDLLQKNSKYIETTVTLGGWVRTRRDSKIGISFIAVNDGSTLNSIQIIASNELDNYKHEILKLTSGCSIIVTGILTQSPGTSQLLEIHAKKIEIIGWIHNPYTYPLPSKYHTLEYLREHAHLRPRTNIIGAVTRLRHCLSIAIHRFFNENNFLWIHTPIITSSDCEGAGQTLRVTNLDFNNLPITSNGKIDFSQDFFNKEAFLTVSGQLNVECYCEALTKVYTFGPTFRAENSNTSRHLAEFWMVEPEIAFADLSKNAILAEDMLRYLIQYILTKSMDDMKFFADKIDKNCIDRLEKILEGKFICMEYTDAIQILQKSNKKFEFPVQWGIDLQSEHERYLTEEFIKGPIILKNYPKEIKSFYMRLNDDEKTVAAMDVLVPGIGEIIGGSQREERYEILVHRMQELNLNIAKYKWYLDLRRYGTVPHAGFGLGLERMIMYMTGVQNIRDTIPFPRAVHNVDY